MSLLFVLWIFSFNRLQLSTVITEKKILSRRYIFWNAAQQNDNTATWLWSKRPGDIARTDYVMCMFGVSFLVSACVCDLCRVQMWCCSSLLSSQAHKVTLAFAVSLHTHSHTCLRTYTRHTQTHTFTPFTPSLLVAPISGFSVSIILLVWAGLIISVCVCVQQCVYLYPCTVFLCLCWCVGDTRRDCVIFSMHMCGQVWFLCMWTVNGGISGSLQL